MKPTRSHLCRLFLFAACALLSVRGGSASGEIADRSWRLPLDAVDSHGMPRVDVRRLLEEDETNRGYADAPLRVGYAMDTDLSPSSSGTWEDLSDGGRLWRLQVTSDDALWMVLGFDTFRLQPGAALRVYDPDRDTVLGPFTSADVREHGQLWLPPILGDTLILEIEWPEGQRDRLPDIHLGTVSHGYRSAWGMGDRGPAYGSDGATVEPKAGSCNVDVACPLGDDWQSERRGVIQMLTGGGILCSASLVATTARDCRPYVLTAAHCVNSASAAASTSFRFNYERPGCGNGSASTAQTLLGSTLVATYGPSDFSLLEMDEDPPAEFEPFFNGWNRAAAAAEESWTIHHASGGPKKISYSSEPPFSGQTTGWGPDHWRVRRWAEGTTEPGSSGSPLFDQNQRIIGQLHGGTASCSSNTWDEFGKLRTSWSGGGTPTSRLNTWLDPLDTGEVGIDGFGLETCASPTQLLAVDDLVVEDSIGNGDDVIDPGETLTLVIALENVDDLPATMVTGRLISATGTVLVTRKSAAWPDIPAGSVGYSADPGFELRVNRTHPCGLPIVLDLEVASAGHVELLRLELRTGNLAYECQPYARQPREPSARTARYDPINRLSANRKRRVR